jgi:N-acetylmuramoyl-L-alanine amidase
LRAPRPALVGGIALAIAITPILAATALAADPTVVVQPGDTLTGIARRHRVSIGRIVALNDLVDPNRIFAGQRLRVGRDGNPRPARAAAPRREATVVHVVTRGATVWGIAQHYRVSVSAIVAANRIANPSRIFAGQRLVIPRASAARSSGSRAPAARAPRREATVVHVVTPGATLSGIALRYRVSVSAIAAANGIANPSRIFIGQRLVIPGVSARASGPTSRPSKANLPPSMAQLMARRDGVRRIIVRQADRQGVPRAFALAVAWQESGWQQDVVSHAGAVGVMQLMPGTAEWIGDTMLGRPVRIRDAGSNIEAGVRLLRHYLNRYDGNRDLVLAAYYQGQRAVDTYGIYRISRPYIASIRSIERLLGG